MMKYNRVLCVACAVAVAFLTLFASCATAFAANSSGLADWIFTDISVKGCKPITISEAQDAAFTMYSDVFGMDRDEIASLLWFSADTENDVVYVYQQKDGSADEYVFDIIYYNTAGLICSYGLGYGINPSELSGQISTTVQAGLASGFAFATKAFEWIISNALASFLLGLSFTFAAFNLLRYGIRTVRRI